MKRNKKNNKCAIDLNEIFDLSKIPEDELRMQHHDISLEHSDSCHGLFNHGDLYHLAPSCCLNDILTHGLQPGYENESFNYPDGIFMFPEDTPMNAVQLLGKQLYKASSNPNNNGEYALLRIDSDGLKNGYSLHYDSYYEFGVFTQQAIPPNLISVSAKMFFQK